MKTFSIFSIITLIGGGILALTIFFGSWYQVSEGYRGVLLQNGAIISEEPIQPGLNFKLPIVQDVDYIDVQAKKVVFEALSTGSSDLQQAVVRVSVNYRITEGDVIDVRRSYTTEANLVDRALYPKVYESVKQVFSQYKAEDTIRKREELTTAIYDDLIEAVTGPILVESIQIEDIQLSPEFMENIEDKANQTLIVQTLGQMEQQAIVRARTKVVEAQAEADAQLALAQGVAKGIEVKGIAEANAITARGQALKQNPDVVALVQAEKWNGVLPTTMVPNSTVPFIDVNPAR